MEENIEVKDVQKTEYLDKTGLDMLWTKVKENTHNQVEVEYNRAKAKEDSLSQEIASVKPAEGKVFLQVEDAEDGEGTKILKDDSLLFGDYRSQQAFSAVTSAGFSVKKDAQEVAVLPTGIKADVERGSDTKVWNTNGGITDLTSYALNSDVTEKIAAKADTTALTALEEKVTANTTAIEGKQDAGNYIPYELYSSELYGEYYKIPKDIAFQSDSSNGNIIMVSSQAIRFNGNAEGRATIIGPSSIRLEKNDGNLYLGKDSISSYYDKFDINFELNKNGIMLRYGTNNEVLTSGGSTIDITQYAKKAELPTVPTSVSQLTNDSNFITAADVDLTPYAKKSELPTAATKEKLGVVKVGDGLNVTDGTISVDTTAIGTGNYIPYESIDDRFGRNMYITKRNEGILFNSGSGNVSISDGEIQIKNTVRGLSLTNDFIWLKEISDNGSTETNLVQLDKNGLWLRDGDNDHVLTSNGSTIDITEYVLKSVYNKKIAALEARIAALEAKHAEAA